MKTLKTLKVDRERRKRAKASGGLSRVLCRVSDEVAARDLKFKTCKRQIRLDWGSR